MRWRKARAVLGRGARGLGLAALAGLGAWLVLDRACPFPAQRFEEWPVSGEVRAADGRVIGARVGPDDQWRRPLDLDAMGPWLAAATIAVEDERFASHPGVDPLAILRAARNGARAGRVVSGASTLSMQVCRMLEPRPRTLTTKLAEAFRAVQLERRYSKDEILAFYLNTAPYGGNVRGVGAAARHWFDKEPAALSLGEAALLAGLPQSPERLRPDRHPDAARARRARVLAALFAAGRIDDAQRRAADAEPVVLARRARADVAPHLTALALARRPGGGTTTLDLGLQEALVALAEVHARELPQDADLALVVVDVRTGALRALIGSADPRDPRDGRVNGATARRSPGSALKPFVYAAAFECGRLQPDDELPDRPADFAGWRPRNFERGFDGDVAVGDALRRSLNLPALHAARLAGLERCAGLLEGLGLDLGATPVGRSGLALVLGGAEVRLLDLVGAYATLARGGEHVPVSLFAGEPVARPRRVLRAATCDALAELLGTDLRVPRGWDPSRARPPRFAWKTGTSAGQRDAWAVGFDERHAVGVWIGRFAGGGDDAFVGERAAEPLLTRVFLELAP